MILASCTKSPEDKAKDLITSSINAIPLFKEYEPLTFGALNSAKISYLETEEYLRYHRELEESLAKIKDYKELSNRSFSKATIDMYTDKMNEAYNQMLAINDSIEIAKANFTYDTTMVSMSHTFRCYNVEENRYMIVPITFYFDAKVTKIKGMEGYSNGDSGDLIYAPLLDN